LSYDTQTVLDELRRLRPDVIVQDLSMPPTEGIDIIRAIREVDQHVKIIVVTMWEDPKMAADAFRRGAWSSVLKNCAASELHDAIRLALDEKSYVTPLIAGGMIGSLT